MREDITGVVIPGMKSKPLLKLPYPQMIIMKDLHYMPINDFVSEHSIVLASLLEKGVVATRANVDGLEVFATGMHLFQNIVISE